MTTTTSNIKVMITTRVPAKPVRRMPASEADDRKLKNLYKAFYKQFPGLKEKCSDVRIINCE